MQPAARHSPTLG
jgi:hypothetical protein